MSEPFMRIDERTGRTYSGWHEDVDDCDDCHKAGRHLDEELKYADSGCSACEEAAEKSLTFSYEVGFTFDQYRQAKLWEAERRFNYRGDIARLMFEWMNRKDVELLHNLILKEAI